ncbi:hypothetical protein QML37_31135, partial [Klebsiella pneumoniae]|uniref:hypothetical protein n=1 Tax=Klebsiella pneumoniae TaxID=573 RepID=UPI003A7F7485
LQCLSIKSYRVELVSTMERDLFPLPIFFNISVRFAWLKKAMENAEQQESGNASHSGQEESDTDDDVILKEICSLSH